MQLQIKERNAKTKAGLSNIPRVDIEQDAAKERERLAVDQVLNDWSLERGDIVSTTEGLFIFQGRPDRARSPQDFVPVR